MTGESHYGDKQDTVKTFDGGCTEITISGRVNDPRVITSRSHVDSKTLQFLEGLDHATAIEAGSSVKF